MTNWTKTPPTEPGWYWWRGYYVESPEILQVEKFSHGWRAFYQGEWWTFLELEGEWWPERIPEPGDE